MKRFLFAWELGSGYGHLAQLRDVADAVSAHGHRVSVAMRDLSQAATVFGERAIPVYQAPLWLPLPRHLPVAITYPELLLRFGFSLPDRLRPLIDAWRRLLRERHTECLLAEHAPTAVLAAHSLGIPVVLLGTGFTVPPAARPMPVVIPGMRADAARIESAERVVLDGINAILERYGQPGLEHPGALFRCQRRYLFTWPELDPYAHARGDDDVYLGARLLTEMGVAPRWPAGEGPRVFAYLNADMPHQAALLQALAACGAVVLAHIPGVTSDQRERFESATLRITPEPVSMAAVTRECAAAVCLAGHGTTSALLLAGIPVLLLPSQVEQLCTALLVEARTLGAMLDMSGITRDLREAPDFSSGLARVLGDGSLRAGARAFAQHHRALAEGDPFPALVAGLVQAAA